MFIFKISGDFGFIFVPLLSVIMGGWMVCLWVRTPHSGLLCGPVFLVCRPVCDHMCVSLPGAHVFETIRREFFDGVG